MISLGKLTGALLIKRRYALEAPNRRIVYDVFQGELKGLIMAEVEFKDYDSLLSFEQECSSWEDVTSNPYDYTVSCHQRFSYGRKVTVNYRLSQ